MLIQSPIIKAAVAAILPVSLLAILVLILYPASFLRRQALICQHKNRSLCLKPDNNFPRWRTRVLNPRFLNPPDKIRGQLPALIVVAHTGIG